MVTNLCHFNRVLPMFQAAYVVNVLTNSVQHNLFFLLTKKLGKLCCFYFVVKHFLR